MKVTVKGVCQKKLMAVVNPTCNVIFFRCCGGKTSIMLQDGKACIIEDSLENVLKKVDRVGIYEDDEITIKF